MISVNLDNFWSRVAKSIAHLGCDTDAGKLAALGGVERLLAGHGFGYLDLADRVRGSATPPQAGALRDTPTPSFFDMARACRDLDCGRLTQPEKKFVGEMCRLGIRCPSARQAQWLGDIFAKLHRRAA